MRKLFIKLLAVIFAVMTCGLLFAACDPTPPEEPPQPDGHDYTVTVVDVDGSACDWVRVQVCSVAPNGEPGACYMFFKQVDENGVVYLDIEEDKMMAEEDWIEIHLHTLPDYITYDTARMHKGESLTINLRYKTAEELDAPNGGLGTASYLLGDEANRIDLSEGAFNPYEVVSGAEYSLKFTSADQKIYFALSLTAANDYKAYVVGGLAVNITQLSGNPTDGIYNTGSEDMSAIDTDPSYSFSVEGEQTVYFEVSLVDASCVNKQGIICFAFDA